MNSILKGDRNSIEKLIVEKKGKKNLRRVFLSTPPHLHLRSNPCGIHGVEIPAAFGGGAPPAGSLKNPRLRNESIRLTEKYDCGL